MSAEDPRQQNEQEIIAKQDTQQSPEVIVTGAMLAEANTTAESARQVYDSLSVPPLINAEVITLFWH